MESGLELWGFWPQILCSFHCTMIPYLWLPRQEILFLAWDFFLLTTVIKGKMLIKSKSAIKQKYHFYIWETERYCHWQTLINTMRKQAILYQLYLWIYRNISTLAIYFKIAGKRKWDYASVCTQSSSLFSLEMDSIFSAWVF